MQVHEKVRILAAETLNDGLVIKFNDGKCAFYSTPLLRATYTQALELDEPELPATSMGSRRPPLPPDHLV